MNSSTPACVEAAGFAGLRNLNFHGDCRSNDVRCAKEDGGITTKGRKRDYMSLDVSGIILRVERTLPAITEIFSFVSGKHGHAVCLEILVKLPWIGMMEAPYSTGITGRHQRPSPKGAARMPLRTLPTGQVDLVLYRVQTKNG